MAEEIDADHEEALKINRLVGLIALYESSDYHPESPLVRDFYATIAFFGPLGRRTLKTKLNIPEKTFAVYLEEILKAGILVQDNVPSTRGGMRKVIRLP